MPIHGLGRSSGTHPIPERNYHESKETKVAQQALPKGAIKSIPTKLSDAHALSLDFDTTEGSQDTSKVAMSTFRPITPESPKAISPVHTREQAELNRGSRNLRETSRDTPMIPSNMGEDDANDVYMTHDMVFKPGKGAAERAQMCYCLARIVGVEDTVVPAKRGTATIVASQDVNRAYEIREEDDGVRRLEHRIPLGPLPGKIKNGDIVVSQGIKMRIDKEEGLYSVEVLETPLDRCLHKTQTFVPLIADNGTMRLAPYDKTSKVQGKDYIQVELTHEGLLICEGKSYVVEKNEDGSFNVKAEPQALVHFVKDNLFSIERHPDDLDYLVLEDEDNENQIFTDNVGDFVWRHGEKHRLEPVSDEPDKFHVVGRDITGMVQSKVIDVFTGEEGKPLNMLQPSPERTRFYESIQMSSFIPAFFLTSILRTQDGKIASELGKSNILFKDGKSFLIDLDETMPSSNDFSVSPELTKKGKKDQVHSVRNGLMGFPQAHVLLQGDDKTQAIALLKQILTKKKDAETFFKTFINDNDFNETHIDAYKEVVDKIETFLNEQGSKDWSLADLFLNLFPEYKTQWDLLGSTDPAMKALLIGKESRASIEAYAKERP